MKVSGPGKTQGPSKSKKSSGSSNSDSANFGALMNTGPSEAATTSPTQSIAQVDALLAIQGAEDPTQGASRKRMRHRANTILDALDTLRDSLLGDNITIGHMVGVADVVASHREKITDPELTSLMDEIDLRAQVELAKLRVAMDKAAKESSEESTHNN